MAKIKLSERLGITLQAVDGLYDVAADVLASFVPRALLDANTLLHAVTDNTPAALAVAAKRLVGRKASGDIAALTGVEVSSIIDEWTSFAFSSGAASLDVSAGKNFAASAALAVNSAITITGGADGMSGLIAIKQGASAYTLDFTISGRTILKDLNVNDHNPFSAAASITLLQYTFFSCAGTGYCLINKAFTQ